MSENVSSADNQQGSRPIRNRIDPSETTRRSPKNEEIIAYLHGALHDASLNKGKRIRFVQKYPEWLLLLQKLLEKVGSRSWMYKEGKGRNLYTLETLCRLLSFDFDPLTLKDKKTQRAYVRGFFDAEGGIPRTEDTFYIQLVQKDKTKILALKKMLDSLGISTGKVHNPSHRVDPNYWRIFVSTKDHKEFACQIGSWHPVKGRIFKSRMVI